MRLNLAGSCQDAAPRRNAVRAKENLNGLDYLEVSPDQRRLTLYFLDKAPEHLRPGNIRFSGGRRISGEDLRVLEIKVCHNQDPERDDCLSVQLNQPGDFSCYTLCLVEADHDGHPTDQPLVGFDPRYRCLDFSFKVNCPSDLDCAEKNTCIPALPPEPALDYLAKDYATFRQLILDRLALNVPDWQERHVPDLGITLVELLAYVGDYLSYQQDVVATEAYLDTANQRISVRRHARLVDYQMHEGCAARALVCLEVSQDISPDLSKAKFITGLESLPDGPVSAEQLRAFPAGSYDVFEVLGAGKQSFYQAHNQLQFYTWKGRECCLPAGSTQATLQEGRSTSPETPDATGRHRQLNLHGGDLLIFEEICSPRTGKPADADPCHRHAVRLTRVTPGVDPLDDQPILHIEWHAEDALPFTLCLSAQGPDCEEHEISVARGNVVLVGHGETVEDCLGMVESAEPEQGCECDCEESQLESDLPRHLCFRPRLTRAPIVFQEQIPAGLPSVSRLMAQNPRAAQPALTLTSWVPQSEIDPCADPPQDAQTWHSAYDLLESGPDDQHFVLEVDDDRAAHLRFGDDQQGRRPEGGQVFQARYRVGGGLAGNVGAGAIRHLIGSDFQGGILSVRNPLPAQGGYAPEPVAEVKQFAPYTFRSHLERAVTADDYAALTEREFPEVQRAAARLVWTGSGYAVQVAVDALRQTEPSPELLKRIERRLSRYRRIGHDLEVRPAELVPLEVNLRVCVQPHFLRAHVKAQMLRRLGLGVLPDGTRGFFHPDNLSFGQAISLSALVVAAREVTGVTDVQVTRLQPYSPRQTVTDSRPLNDGQLTLGPFQIPRLDNDPSVPENGVLKLELRGGR